MRDKIFYISVFGFLLGTLTRSFVFIYPSFILFILTLSLSIVLTSRLYSLQKTVLLTSILVLCFTLGVLRFHFSEKVVPVIETGESISLSGIIVDEPSIGDKNQKLMVETTDFKILVSTGLEKYFHYGDEVNIKGKLKKPENFITDQGKEFDYVSYLRKDGIFFVSGFPRIEIVSRGNGNFIKEMLFSAKKKFLNILNVSIPAPESLLLGGLILGERSSFGEEMRQEFIDTGTIHIVALSGYNVTIVAEWIMKLFSFLPKTAGFSAGILGIFLFVIMAGGQSTAVRAGIMAVLALIARATNREYDVARGLTLAALIMVIINPHVLAFDVSFQLSFIATVAVIFIAPRYEKYFNWIKLNWLRDIICTTFSAYIFVLPFLLYKTGNLSLVALPANILVLPLIPITMIFGFLTGFTGFISMYLSAPFAQAAYLLLHYELWVIDSLAKVPFASFGISYFPLILTITIYGWFLYHIFGKDIKDFFFNSEL